MVLTYARCYEHIDHALHGEPAIGRKEIVDQAGEYLMTMHPWSWANGQMAYLDLRGSISVTAGALDATGKILTEASSFDDYTWVAGDQFEATGGTGVTTGHVEVVSRTSGNVIVLGTSLGTDSPADVTGTLDLHTVALPTDFAGMVPPISVAPVGSVIAGVRMVSLETLLRARSVTVEVSSDWQFLGAITYAQDQRTPILEIYPTPTADDAEKFQMFYRRGWSRGTSDQNEIKIPEWMEGFFVLLVRAYAQGYEEEPEGSLLGRLEQVESSQMLRAMKKRDGSVQVALGPLRNSAVRRSHGGFGSHLITGIAGPS